MMMNTRAAALRLQSRCRHPNARNALGGRALHATRTRRDGPGSGGQPVSDVVQAETEDVSSMDVLLKAVRDKSDPAFHNIMPMRIPILWAEALQVANQKATPSSLDDVSATREPPKLGASVDLTPRRMQDSYSEFVLPFGESKELLEQYTNASGGIRTGKLMEHLDSLAGSIAYKHMLGPGVSSLGRLEERGFYIVTASVDRLDMISPLDSKRNLRLSGQVIFTGRSSMEVAVKMESIGQGLPDETDLIGRFSMVCRDAATHKARPVNPLVISCPEEKSLQELGEHIKRRRQNNALKDLSRVPPTSAEAEELHTFYLQHGQGQTHDPQHHVWMGDTVLEKCMLMFPQERNVHQKIFGGYLMRLAYELGFTNASMFTRGHVRFLSLDGISFARPVPIGSILRLRSQILHTTSSDEHPILVHVGVKANVVDVKTGSEQTTNEFRFTWCQPKGYESQDLRAVVPKTYQEAMLWLEGKRALEVGAEIRGSRK